MKIVKLHSKEEVGSYAANIIEKQLERKPDSLFGFATGDTPIPLYRELISRKLDFSLAKTVNLDEYAGISPTHPQSYRRFMDENLFEHINIKYENTHLPNGEKPDCEAYEKLISELGGIDLQVLGIGHDGHIGFNEPAESFQKATHLQELSEMTRQANSRFFSSVSEVPEKAVTMGVGTVMNAEKIIMLVTGRDKAKILKKALCGEITPLVPASALQFHHDLTVICDSEAGYEL